MKLTEIYKERLQHTKTMPFQDGEIEVKLFLYDEADEFSKLVLDPEKWNEFLAKSIFEDGQSIFEAGKIDVFANVPNEHKQQLMKLITQANGGSASFEEKKSD